MAGENQKEPQKKGGICLKAPERIGSGGRIRLPTFLPIYVTSKLFTHHVSGF